MSNSNHIVMDRSLVRFYAGIRTEQTRRDYERYLSYFLKFVKIKLANGLLQLKDVALQEMVEDYIISLKSKGLSKSYIDAQISGLELFFAMNDKILNFKKIRKMTPLRKKLKGNMPYTNEEIKKMLESTTSSRNKAIIHLMASTGCRVGAIPNLRFRNITEMSDECKMVTFYEGEAEEYVSFLTPEASQSLTHYLQKRKNDGEIFSSDSPLFRDAYRIGIGKVKSITLKAIRNMICELVIKIRGRIGRNNHRSTAMTHGFRKRFNTILKDSSLGNIALKEKLMGHATKLIPLDTVYHNPKNQTLFEEFKLHITELSVSDEERQKAENSKLRAELTENGKLKERITNLEEFQEKVLSFIVDAQKNPDKYLDLKKPI